jgi:hypothetical protein
MYGESNLYEIHSRKYGFKHNGISDNTSIKVNRTVLQITTNNKIPENAIINAVITCVSGDISVK